MRDISKRAGVSTFAVSQALGGKSGVGEETRDRILEIADSLGYVPNRLAANLKGQTSRTIGVMTASGRNQYYTSLVQGIDRVLQADGYHAVTNDAMRGGRYDARLERESVEALLQQRVSAIIATYSLNSESLAILEKWDLPLLFVDALPPEAATRYPFVGSDNYTASALVAQYFADLGMQKTAYLAYPPEWNTRYPRERGFTETASRLGIAVDTIESDNSAESAFDSVREYLGGLHGHDVPQAIYATNIVLLQGALKALRSMGLSVPEDISIVGFDDFDWADLIEPAITVVDQHTDLIGQEAGGLIVELIENTLADDVDARHIAIEPELIVRDSCRTYLPAGRDAAASERDAAAGESLQ